MATITVRKIPETVMKELKATAARNGRSMEEEVRQLLTERYATREVILERIRERWKDLPEVSPEEVNEWIRVSRRGR